MTGSTIIERAAAGGVQLQLSSSGRISVKGFQLAVHRWLPDIRKNKDSILKILRPIKRCWSVEDWQAFYDERAAIAEFDGCLSRSDAEASAFQHCIDQYLALHAPSNPDSNIACECRSNMGPEASATLDGETDADILAVQSAAAHIAITRALRCRQEKSSGTVDERASSSEEATNTRSPIRNADCGPAFPLPSGFNRHR